MTMELYAFLVIFALWHSETACADLNVNVDLDLDHVVNEVDERYLSVALEASIFKKKWATFNIRLVHNTHFSRDKITGILVLAL